jgi:hypothetical protein
MVILNLEKIGKSNSEQDSILNKIAKIAILYKYINRYDLIKILINYFLSINIINN